MVKTVYTGQEVPHVFAANPMADARNSNSTLRAESGVLWSYQQPIAAIVAGQLLVTSDSFSVTTSKHTTWARYALSHMSPLFVPDLKSLVRNDSELAMSEYIAKRVKDIAAIEDSMTRMRADWKRLDARRKIASLEAACQFAWNVKLGKKTDWRSAVAVLDKFNTDQAKRRYQRSGDTLADWERIAADIVARCRDNIAADVARGRNQSFWHMERAIQSIGLLDEMSAYRGLSVTGSATFDHAAKLLGKRWAKQCIANATALIAYTESLMPEYRAMRAEHDAAQLISNADILAEWLAGGRYAPQGAVVCRVIGDTVETSKGASVPLADALAVVVLARKCRDTGKGLNLENRQIGNYRGTRIDSEGNLTVGCHHITWDAIADCVARFEASKESVE